MGAGLAPRTRIAEIKKGTFMVAEVGRLGEENGGEKVDPADGCFED
jgi:hypothetical protein